MKQSQERPTPPHLKPGAPQTVTELTADLCRIIRIQTDIIDTLYIMLLQHITANDIPASTWHMMQEAALMCREILGAGGAGYDVR